MNFHSVVLEGVVPDTNAHRAFLEGLGGCRVLAVRANGEQRVFLTASHAEAWLDEEARSIAAGLYVACNQW